MSFEENKVVLVRRGEKYSKEYTDRLKEQLLEHAHKVPEIVGDGEDATRQVQTSWTGWWAKMELFAPWNIDLRPMLYIDLDTVILKNIVDMVDHDIDRFMMCREWVKGASNVGQSSVMFIPKDVDTIWRDFMEDADYFMTTRYHGGGDQAFLEAYSDGFIQDYYDGICSYKVHGIDDGSRIACFHGRPKPPEVEGIWK